MVKLDCEINIKQGATTCGLESFHILHQPIVDDGGRGGKPKADNWIGSQTTTTTVRAPLSGVNNKALLEP